MTQIFRPRANGLASAILLALAGSLAVVGAAAAIYANAPAATGEGRVVEQPVPFSHAHHVGGLGIDCRYCHTSVEISAFAGLPSTETCMTCHSQLWTNAEMLRPVRRSLENGTPLRWKRVHDLPDFVYFNHSAHVANGVACESCHGRVDRMPLMHQAKPLTMGWCLDCHRNPAGNLRPKEDVFAMGWRPPEDKTPQQLGAELMHRYAIETGTLTDCSTCHR